MLLLLLLLLKLLSARQISDLTEHLLCKVDVLLGLCKLAQQLLAVGRLGEQEEVSDSIESRGVQIFDLLSDSCTFLEDLDGNLEVDLVLAAAGILEKKRAERILAVDQLVEDAVVLQQLLCGFLQVLLLLQLTGVGISR